MKRFLLIFAVFLFACQAKSPSETVAREFVEAYYVRADLPKVLLWTDGYATEKVNTSIRLIEGQVKEATTRPKVAYKLLESQVDGQEARHLFLLKIKPPTYPEIQKKALVRVRERKTGEWKVTQFSEIE